MTAPNRARRTCGWAAALGMALGFGVVPGALAADPPAPQSRLESPMADLAVIPSAPGSSADTTPDLLVLDADPIEPNQARVSILRRASSWDRVAVHDIELGESDLDARWLIALGDRHYALIATSSTTAPGNGRAVVVGVQVRDEGGAPTLVESGRSTIDRAVEDAGAADVDGLGSPELVLGLRPRYDASGSCGTTTLDILDSANLAVRRSIQRPGQLGYGVIGRFDPVPGDDLLVGAAPDCPPGGQGRSGLVVIRLRDGTVTTIGPGIAAPDVPAMPPPLRLPEAGGRDAAVVALNDGVSLVDGSGHAPRMITPGPGVPIVAGPDTSGPDGSARLAWLANDGLHSAHLRIGRDGSTHVSDISSLGPDQIGAGRWPLIVAGTANDLNAHGVASAWLGDLAETGCPDLVVPGAIEPCGPVQLRSGASWVATRLLAILPIDGRRTALVAAGMSWDPKAGVPTSPTPWAAAPAGWWRHGPSTPFVMSETRASDVVYFHDFPVPRTTIEPTTGRDGMTTMPGFTGTRMFVTVQPLTDDEDGSTTVPGMRDAFVAPTSSDAVARIARVPVPPGNEFGRDGAYTTLSLGDIKAAGATSTGRWGVQVVAINDWGEVGEPVVGTVTRDITGPTLNLETPFTNPVWPFLTDLSGRTEPGSKVSVDGATIDVDQRGRFTVVTRLAPWPQDIRLSATDDSGNTSNADFSIVGGVDYRQFPWALIVALTLLGIVAVRGLRAAGRRPGGFEATPWSLGTLDADAMPEIEELPPGAGLARKRTP